MADLLGIEELRKQLKQKQTRVKKRYSYYEMKEMTKDFGIAIPDKLQWYKPALGWCGKAVDSLADRLIFREFENDNFDINEIFLMNNPDTFFDSAILSALIGSCAFVYISEDDDGFPTLQVIDGRYATGVIDPMTGLLTEGYAVLEHDAADEEGDVPKFGQFQQQSMGPHVDQLRMFAGLFAGETGLTIDDLGFPSDNPASAEAIKSAHENLRLIARKAQRTFGTAFLNVGYLAACLRDDFPYERRQLYLTKPTWEPIFEPDASALSSYGDGAIKINQAIPGYFDEKRMRDLTGF